LKSDQSIITYLLLFLILATFAKTVGLLNINYSEIFGYALIFYGIADVYLVFGSHKKIRLFFSAAAFIVGIYLFIINNFIVFGTNNLIPPLILFVIAGSFLIIYLDNYKLISNLVISLIFLILGIISIQLSGSDEKGNIFLAVNRVILSYWPIFLIAIGIILLIRKR